jgi:hypothetical protein
LLNKKLKDKDTILQDKEQQVNKLTKLNDVVQAELASNIEKKDALEWDIRVIQTNIENKKEEVNKTDAELSQTKIKLEKAKKDEANARNVALRLMKKEEKLNKLSKNIHEAYEKAGVPLNL